tara:strand:+ start:1691 stop:3169 length:1479 start_codon:yes stop_codon:yes gene_type:complete
MAKGQSVKFYDTMAAALNPIQRRYEEDPRRSMAASLRKSSMGGPPITSHMQGLASLAEAGLGAYMENQAFEEKEAATATASQQIVDALAAGQPQIMPAWYEEMKAKGEDDDLLSAPAFVEENPNLYSEKDPYNPGGMPAVISSLKDTGNSDQNALIAQLQMGEFTRQQAVREDAIQRKRDSDALKDSRLYTEGRDDIKAGRNAKLELDKRKLKIGDDYDKIALQSYFREKQAHDKAYLQVGQTPPPFRPFVPSPEPQVQITNRQATALPEPTPSVSQPDAAQPQPLKQAVTPVAPAMSLADAQALQVQRKAANQQIGKNLAKSQFDLPMVENNSKYLIKALDAVLAPLMDASGKPIIKDGAFVPGKEHPGLESSIGVKSWGGILENLPYNVGGPIPGTDAADFTASLAQVTGKQFLQAFETLKGGGQITEIEGTKATEALANLSNSQSEKQFRKALLAFRYEVGELVKIAKKRASTSSLNVGESLINKYGLK